MNQCGYCKNYGVNDATNENILICKREGGLNIPCMFEREVVSSAYFANDYTPCGIDAIYYDPIWVE